MSRINYKRSTGVNYSSSAIVYTFPFASFPLFYILYKTTKARCCSFSSKGSTTIFQRYGFSRWNDRVNIRLLPPLYLCSPPVRRNRGATLFANFSPDPSLFHTRQKASQEYEADFFTDESHVLILLSAMERCERRWGWNFFFLSLTTNNSSTFQGFSVGGTLDFVRLCRLIP